MTRGERNKMIPEKREGHTEEVIVKKWNKLFRAAHKNGYSLAEMILGKYF